MAVVELEIEYEFDQQSVEAAFMLLEADLTAAVRGLTVDIWNNVLRRTPQYEGRMAASWTYSLNNPIYVDRSGQVDNSGEVTMTDDGAQYRYSHTGIKRKGDLAAIQISNEANIGHDRSFKLGDTVFISNGVDHGEGPYSQDVEDGVVRLRAVNKPGNAVGRTLDMIHSRFSEDMTPRAASIFSSQTIGFS